MSSKKRTESAGYINCACILLLYVFRELHRSRFGAYDKTATRPRDSGQATWKEKREKELKCEFSFNFFEKIFVKVIDGFK